MAKKNMIEREKKRERLINKYGKKRKELKESLKGAETYRSQTSTICKIRKAPKQFCTF